MHLTWLTDTHLNCLTSTARHAYYEAIRTHPGGAVLITGDIAESLSLVTILQEMADHIQKPLYFVLGNHDYYHSSVDAVRQEVASLCATTPALHWLPSTGVVQLTSSTALLGVDGWADGRAGDFMAHAIQLDDSRCISPLIEARRKSQSALLSTMQRLADADAQHCQRLIHKAMAMYHPAKILIAMHVPPFAALLPCLEQSPQSVRLPYMVSDTLGKVLLDAAKTHPDVIFDVYCGHIHTQARYQPCHNMQVFSGSATYGQPGIQAELISASPHDPSVAFDSLNPSTRRRLPAQE